MTLDEKVGQMTQVDKRMLDSEEDIAKFFLGSITVGLKEMMEEKLSLNTELFNPFQSLAGFENIEISNPEQYAVATGLAVRGFLDE